MKNFALLFASVALVGFSYAQVLEETSFETPFNPGVLDTQQGWVSSAGMLVQNTTARTGSQGVEIDTAPITAAYGWKLFGTTPFITSDVVVTTAWVRYNDSTPADRSDNSAFGIEAWSSDGTDRVGTLLIGGDGKGYLKAGFADATVNVGSVVTNADTWHRLTLAVDVAGKQVLGYLNGTQLGSPLTNSTVIATNVSDVDLAAYAFGAYSQNFGVTTGGGFNKGFYDDYRSVRMPVKSVSGQVDLQNWGGVTAGRSISVTLRDSVGNDVVTASTTLNAAGEFNVAFPSAANGNYSVSIKASHWLSSSQNNVVLANIGAHNISVSLKNGDVNDDNEVGAADFSALAAAYDAVNGDANFNAEADLNGDDEIGAADFSILAANYDEVGS